MLLNMERSDLIYLHIYNTQFSDGPSIKIEAKNMEEALEIARYIEESEKRNIVGINYFGKCYRKITKTITV